ncbi:hypothetical protein [Achromobacter sp.]|uniref:hypothetical protein n=1 Tax=Achromobacter sp. TaxID=134375 RepID=UPI0028B1A226|nr:hypothetical protein [Achromobacter sp.]
MSFHTTIARLREAATTRAAGDNSDHCSVRRDDLRVAIHVIDRLDADLRQTGALSHEAAADAPRPTHAHRAAAVRLTQLAKETRAIYGRETSGGGEPAYPSWTGDVLLLASLAPRKRGLDHA